MKNELIKVIYNSVLVENIEIYRDLFENSKIEIRTTEYWKSTLELYEKLSSADKQIFLRIVEQTVVDTISNMLGVIDGSSTLTGFQHEIGLTVGNQFIQSDLQDVFLEMVEKSKK